MLGQPSSKVMSLMVNSSFLLLAAFSYYVLGHSEPDITPILLAMVCAMLFMVSGSYFLQATKSTKNKSRHNDWSGPSALAVDVIFSAFILVLVSLAHASFAFIPIVVLTLCSFMLLIQKRLHLNFSDSAEVALARIKKEIVLSVRQQRSWRGIQKSNNRLYDWYQRIDAVIRSKKRKSFFYLILHSVVDFQGRFLLISTISLGVFFLEKSQINVGQFTAVLILIWRMSDILSNWMHQFVEASDGTPFVSEPENNVSNSSKDDDSLAPRPKPGDLTINQPDTEKEGDFQCTVSFGQRVAITGPNGSGKSDLLSHVYGVGSGNAFDIKWDGKDIETFSPPGRRHWIGFLEEEFNLLPIALSDFFRSFSPSADNDAITEALRCVAGENWFHWFQANSEIEALQMHLNPWGRSPRQRRCRYILSLSTAIVSHPILLLLDDPESRIDPVLDQFFRKFLNQISGKTTVLIATHRKEIIRECDGVLQLDKGRIIHFETRKSNRKTLDVGSRPAQPIVMTGEFQQKAHGLFLTGKVLFLYENNQEIVKFSGEYNIEGFRLLSNGCYVFNPRHPQFRFIRPGVRQTFFLPVGTVDKSGRKGASILSIELRGGEQFPVINALKLFSAPVSKNLKIGRFGRSDQSRTDLNFSTSTPEPGFVMFPNGIYQFNPSDAAYRELAIGQSRIVHIEIAATDENGCVFGKMITLKIIGYREGPRIGSITAGPVTAAHQESRLKGLSKRLHNDGGSRPALLEKNDSN